MEHLVGVDAHVLFRLALPDDGRLVAPTVGQVPVQTVDRHIELTTEKPFHLGHGKVVLEHLVPFLVPGDQLLGAPRPETLGVGHGFGVGLLVLLHGLDPGLVATLLRRLEHLPLGQQTGDFVFHCTHTSPPPLIGTADEPFACRRTESTQRTDIRCQLQAEPPGRTVVSVRDSSTDTLARAWRRDPGLPGNRPGPVFGTQCLP